LSGKLFQVAPVSSLHGCSKKCNAAAAKAVAAAAAAAAQGRSNAGHVCSNSGSKTGGDAGGLAADQND
jgi:hypothetical protein